MSNTPHPAIPACNHERRPGTTVCLHCRHAARIAAADRRKKLAFRGAALGIVIAVVAVTGSLSANALRGRLSRPQQSKSPVKVVAAVQPAPMAPSATPDSAASAPSTSVAMQGDGTPSPAAPPFAPQIAMGQSMLPDSVVATRTDSAVMLSFDKPMLRTRLPDKFERFLRATLRQIYGAAVDSSLAAIPDGAIVGQGNLLAELPTRGMHIPVSNGWTLAVYPETRPGQDGPLVVRYRVNVVAATKE